MSPIISGGGGGGGGGLTRLFSSTLLASAASFDITSISSAYSGLELWLYLRGTKAATLANVRLRFNNDSAANYDTQEGFAAGGTAGGSPVAAAAQMFVGNAVAGTATASVFSALRVAIPAYTNTTGFKQLLVVGNDLPTLGTTAGYEVYTSVGLWRSTSAINRITVLPDANNWDIGSSCFLYGVT